MSKAEFAQQVEELAKAKLEKPKRLRDAAAIDWAEIDDGIHRCGAGNKGRVVVVGGCAQGAFRATAHFYTNKERHATLSDARNTIRAPC